MSTGLYIFLYVVGVALAAAAGYAVAVHYHTSEAEALALTDGSCQLPLAEGTACILIRQDEEQDGTTYTTLTPQADGSFTGELWFLDERGIGVPVSVQTSSE